MRTHRIPSGSVKVNPDDIPAIVRAVREAGPKQLGLSERAYDYWIAGNLPKAILVVLDNPELAAAIYRDAERRAIRKVDQG